MQTIYSISDGSVKEQSSCSHLLIPPLVPGDNGNPLCQNDLGVPEQREAVAEIIPGPLRVISDSGSQARITCEPIVANSLDTLKLTFWVEWSTSAFLDRLETAKEIAQGGENESEPLEVAGYQWNCMRTGTSRYNYRLVRGDIKLLLNRRKAGGNIPNVRLEIGSVSCWSPGYLSICQELTRMVELLGGAICKERVSEAHLAADFIGINLSGLPIALQEHWVTKAHSFTLNYDRRKFTGVTLGKGDFMLRIYDKVEELKRSTNKEDFFTRIWGVEKSDNLPVTRVEFQVRRRILHSLSPVIETLADLQASINSLWQYATEDWCRLTNDEVDRNHHQSRALPHPFWRLVKGVKWDGNINVCRGPQPPHKDIIKMRQQSAGLAMSICAVHGKKSDDLEGIISHSQGCLESDLRRLFRENKKDFEKRMQRKKNVSIGPILPDEHLVVV